MFFYRYVFDNLIMLNLNIRLGDLGDYPVLKDFSPGFGE
jgi:hypothetical protein